MIAPGGESGNGQACFWPIWAGLAGISIVFILIFSPQLLTTVPYVLYGSMDELVCCIEVVIGTDRLRDGRQDAQKDLNNPFHRQSFGVLT